MQAILEFFQKFIDSISMDLQFVIDDISEEDTSALGVTWHLGMMKNIVYFNFFWFFPSYEYSITYKATDNGNDRMEGKAFSF